MEIKVEPLEASKINLFPKTETEEIVRNVATILATPKLTVPLYRDFGTSYAQLDKPVNVAQPLLVMDILDAIEKYEPRVEVISVDIKTDEAMGGKLVPEVRLKIK